MTIEEYNRESERCRRGDSILQGIATRRDLQNIIRNDAPIKIIVEDFNVFEYLGFDITQLNETIRDMLIKQIEVAIEELQHLFDDL